MYNHGMNRTPKLRVLFNDAHCNLPSSPHIAQGGPGRFAQTFSHYMTNDRKDVELQSLLFSHNALDDTIFFRKTEDVRTYYEIVYPSELLQSSYKKHYTKKEYFAFLRPWIVELDGIFADAQPDVVFLNGFSLSNWLILNAAARKKIPVVIQHAGIWKKELDISAPHFSPSIHRIFTAMEKDCISNTALQIFLNDFSREAFFSLHKTVLTPEIKKKTIVVPLPVEMPIAKKMTLAKRKHYKIGMVARWDSIKNHAAIFRLASYLKQSTSLQASVTVVTKWAEKLVSDFKTQYEKVVTIVDPMPSKKLLGFYKTQDIIMIPSRFDVSPTVLMEAVLQGKPVLISTMVGWVSDYKTYKLDSLIIDPEASGESIATVLQDLIDNKDTYLLRFKELQQKIIKDHNLLTVYTHYYKLFKKVQRHDSTT